MTFLHQIEIQNQILREFAFKNKSVMELLFIFTYAMLQICLILTTYFITEFLHLIIALFTVIILTTFGLHKLVMESRISILERSLEEMKNFRKSVNLDRKVFKHLQ